MQLLGTHVGGRTCHFTIRLIICLNTGGNGSTSSSLMIPGGFPSLSWYTKSKVITHKKYQTNQKQLVLVTKCQEGLWNYHCIIITATKLNGNTPFPTHPLPWFRIRTSCRYSNKTEKIRRVIKNHMLPKSKCSCHSGIWEPSNVLFLQLMSLI